MVFKMTRIMKIFFYLNIIPTNSKIEELFLANYIFSRRISHQNTERIIKSICGHLLLSAVHHLGKLVQLFFNIADLGNILLLLMPFIGLPPFPILSQCAPFCCPNWFPSLIIHSSVFIIIISTFISFHHHNQ